MPECVRACVDRVNRPMRERERERKRERVCNNLKTPCTVCAAFRAGVCVGDRDGEEEKEEGEWRGTCDYRLYRVNDRDASRRRSLVVLSATSKTTTLQRNTPSLSLSSSHTHTHRNTAFITPTAPISCWRSFRRGILSMDRWICELAGSKRARWSSHPIHMHRLL